MRKNSSSFTSPSPSLSASSIIILQFLIGHPLTKFFSNSLQIFDRNFASFVIIEQAEGLQNLVLGIPVKDFVRHHLQELLVTNGATAIVIDIRNHFLNLLFLRFETQRSHGNLQFL